MISVVGIGNFCSKIAAAFSNYEQYKVYTITSEDMPAYKNAEEYEAKYNNELVEPIKNDDNTEMSVFVEGSEAISGIILKFLENFRSKNITIFYIKSDSTLLSQTEILQDKICFNVLQEYTRSGCFSSIVIFDKIKLENMLPNLTILEYEQQLVNLISSTVHYINVYNNIKPVVSNSSEESPLARIKTYGTSHVGATNISSFFDLQNIEEIKYYFAINSNTLKKEKNLLQTIKNQIKDMKKEVQNISFCIYETEYEQNFVYCCAQTKFIQQPPAT